MYTPSEPRRHNRPHRRRWPLVTGIVIGVPVASVVGVALASGGSTPVVMPGHTATPVAHSSATPTAPSTPSTAADTTGAVGDVFTVTTTDVNGDKAMYDVSVTEVDQTAQLTPYESVSTPGDHMASVRFTIHGVSGNASDDAINDASVIGGDTTQYSASVNGVTNGGDFSGGMWQVKPGETVSGWVAFEVPKGQTVAHIQWAPNSGFDGTHATWNVG